MTTEEFLKIQKALGNSIQRFPNCRIANCECNSKNDEWKKDCNCMCHLLYMDKKFGKDKWKFSDVSKIAKKGVKQNGI